MSSWLRQLKNKGGLVLHKANPQTCNKDRVGPHLPPSLLTPGYCWLQPYVIEVADFPAEQGRSSLISQTLLFALRAKSY